MTERCTASDEPGASRAERKTQMQAIAAVIVFWLVCGAVALLVTSLDDPNCWEPPVLWVRSLWCVYLVLVHLMLGPIALWLSINERE
jgi:hypothetical protein